MCVSHKMIHFKTLIWTADFPELKISSLLSYKPLYHPIGFTGWAKDIINFSPNQRFFGNKSSSLMDLQRLNKHLEELVHSFDFLTAAPIAVHTMTSRFQAQNLFPRFTFHLAVLCIFINTPDSTSFLYTGILEDVLSMTVKHSGSIQFGLTNLFSR